jgi:hypothetical protein
VGDPGSHVAGTVFCVATLAARPGYRVDVGGTFTDLVLVRDGAPPARSKVAAGLHRGE